MPSEKTSKNIGTIVRNVPVGIAKMAITGGIGYIAIDNGPEITEYARQLAEYCIRGGLSGAISLVVGAIEVGGVAALDAFFFVDGAHQTFRPITYSKNNKRVQRNEDSVPKIAQTSDKTYV